MPVNVLQPICALSLPTAYRHQRSARRTSIGVTATTLITILYTYTSPASCGTSIVSIFLHGDHENWDPRLPLLLGSKPDAIVGLNAGLTSYPAWQTIRRTSKRCNSQIIAHALPRLHSAGMNGSEIYNLMRPKEYPIASNPFQRPGQRNLGSVRLPNVPNGFTMRVVGDDEQEPIHPVSAGVPVPVPDMSELFQKTEQFSLNRLD
ncbi:uncharacterized protein F5147DRAFT_767068 [Suillus discolor]|uniref:Uncharacterized protein n=1 Tax=Suillus discolor TaxID=1912936 RepID=A0A9P7K0C2_9AGAM|nr:uncharacterized protein F5147DRAFT_767068 [Suillus discolor]KAG2119585.1 hypothetical protein F5147DRAFT_767068 [Suillus discolor]